jgi:hypothetical protein
VGRIPQRKALLTGFGKKGRTDQRYSETMLVHSLHRRAFLIGLGCAGVTVSVLELSADNRFFGVRRVCGYSGSGIALPAVAAASMPETLVIGHSASGVPMRGKADFQETLARIGYAEYRKYRLDRKESFAGMAETFTRYGIRPLLTGFHGTFLFGFETLASREKAWRELSAEPEWLGIRTQLEELAIYKVSRNAVAGFSTIAAKV